MTWILIHVPQDDEMTTKAIKEEAGLDAAMIGEWPDKQIQQAAKWLVDTSGYDDYEHAMAIIKHVKEFLPDPIKEAL